MKCQNCAFENAETARYCENCGQPLQRTCPNCGHQVSPAARFCSNCGFNLGQGLPGEARATTTHGAPLAALRRAVPQHVADKILAERDRLEGERKLVTTLFTDIVGSTALAEQMDPEDWRDIVAGAHRRVSEAVYRYEGTIAQLLGDGVLAFFGAPLAHEDDAERAVRAGLAILTSVRQYAGELRRRRRVDEFQMRIGLNTGLVVVGNIGSDLHMEYLAVGDTVNLAARMQSAAEPDSLLVSENTHRLVSTQFEFEDRGRITVKGKAEPVQVYRVARERKGARRRRGIAGLASPLVGRRREFDTLMQVATGLREGQGALVAIIGEAGLGKSRLVAEWREAAQAEEGSIPLHWVEGRCLSYGSAIAHHLSIDILRNLIGVGPDAEAKDVQIALLESTEAALGDDAHEVYPFLAHLLGLHLPDKLAARRQISGRPGAADPICRRQPAVPGRAGTFAAAGDPVRRHPLGRSFFGRSRDAIAAAGGPGAAGLCVSGAT